MISVEEAEAMVLSCLRPLPDEVVPLEEGTGRVLREALVADRDFPPFDRVAMDGIAIRSGDFHKGLRSYRILGIQAAGEPAKALAGPGTCLEVMTGAILPQGADAVVRYEDLTMEGGHVIVELDEVAPWQNIHRRGVDRRTGETIVPAGRILSPAEIGVAATVGKAQLKVAARPRVAIISTGDELVPVDAIPEPHQIRSSNVHALQAAIRRWGALTAIHHLPDDLENIIGALIELLPTQQALVLSGGVSMGKFDYLPTALERLGVQRLFHKVAQRPGKPFWFGHHPQGAVVFALPGNPVSAFMCLHRYFLPWMRKCAGLPPSESPVARLTEAVHFTPALTRFIQVKTYFTTDGFLMAEPVTASGSGDLASLADADAFFEMPANVDELPAGATGRLWPYR